MAGNSYHLTVPLDLSDIDDKHADDRVKVVAQAADQTIVSTISTVAELEADPAQLEFAAHPGTVRVAVGPAEAEDRQLLEGDTVHKLVPSRLWDDISRVDIAPIKIGPWYWGRWKRWCRTITVTGRLICPDGRPVPGATVCAYDIDWWFIWSSKQLAGCTTTAADGSFTLTFTWCCGLYPWWWWFQTRPWILDDDLAQLVQRHLGADLRYRLDAPTTLPSLSVFQSLLDRKRGLLGERPILLLGTSIPRRWSPHASHWSTCCPLHPSWRSCRSGRGRRGRRGGTALPIWCSAPPRTAVRDERSCSVKAQHRRAGTSPTSSASPSSPTRKPAAAPRAVTMTA